MAFAKYLSATAGERASLTERLAETHGFDPSKHSLLSWLYLSKFLDQTVQKSGAGYYIGAVDLDGAPAARDSVEYWVKREEAEAALASGEWTQRATP